MTTELLRPRYSNISCTEDECAFSDAVMSTKLAVSIEEKQEPMGHYVPVRPDIITSWSQSPCMNCSDASVKGIDSNIQIVR